MSVRVGLLALVLPLSMALYGCYESPDVTVFEPGVYKGKSDPLLDKQKSAQRDQQLADRFNAVQTDR